MKEENEFTNVEDKARTTEYEAIINYSTGPVAVKTEWFQKGDFFQQLSTYNYNYTPVRTLGSTTLIKPPTHA